MKTILAIIALSFCSCIIGPGSDPTDPYNYDPPPAQMVCPAATPLLCSDGNGQDMGICCPAGYSYYCITDERCYKIADDCGVEFEYFICY